MTQEANKELPGPLTHEEQRAIVRQMARAYGIELPATHGDEMPHEEKRSIVRQMARAYGIDVSENRADRNVSRETSPRTKGRTRAQSR